MSLMCLTEVEPHEKMSQTDMCMEGVSTILRPQDGKNDLCIGSTNE